MSIASMAGLLSSSGGGNIGSIYTFNLPSETSINLTSSLTSHTINFGGLLSSLNNGVYTPILPQGTYSFNFTLFFELGGCSTVNIEAGTLILQYYNEATPQFVSYLTYNLNGSNTATGLLYTGGGGAQSLSSPIQISGIYYSQPSNGVEDLELDVEFSASFSYVGSIGESPQIIFNESNNTILQPLSQITFTKIA